jgi:hypothetical protein
LATGVNNAPPELNLSQKFSQLPKDVHPPGILDVARRGISGSGGPLPYLDAIQRLFGRHDIRKVIAHQDSRAAAVARSIGARAYTTGEHIAFAGSADLHTAAHEAAHVVQQRAGVHLKGEVGEVGDAYERHADAVADRVASGRSAEALLDQMAPAGSRSLAIQRQVVQRDPVQTNYGVFDTTKYEPLGPHPSVYGVEIDLKFTPNKHKVDASKIALVQTARMQLSRPAVAFDPTSRNRMVPRGNTGEGRVIDQNTTDMLPEPPHEAHGNPLYAAGIARLGERLGDTAPEVGMGTYGACHGNRSGSNYAIATLHDTPHLQEPGNNSEQTFETAALAVEGVQHGRYLGSVSWGWSIDGSGTFSKHPLAFVSKGDPSPEFVAAAREWNRSKTIGTIVTTPRMANVYIHDFDSHTFSPVFSVPRGTEVRVLNSVSQNDQVYVNVIIRNAIIRDIRYPVYPGVMRVDDLRDEGNGNPTIPLPIPGEPYHDRQPETR